jgi:hypothetical protein
MNWIPSVATVMPSSKKMVALRAKSAITSATSQPSELADGERFRDLLRPSVM